MGSTVRERVIAQGAGSGMARVVPPSPCFARTGGRLSERANLNGAPMRSARGGLAGEDIVSVACSAGSAARKVCPKSRAEISVDGALNA